MSTAAAPRNNNEEPGLHGTARLDTGATSAPLNVCARLQGYRRKLGF